MAIAYDPAKKRFHIRSEKMSYIMEVGTDELLHHVYWGARLDEAPDWLYDRAPYRRAHLVEGQPADSPKRSLEYFHYECPVYGSGDFRQPAVLMTESETGSSLLDLRYAGHTIRPGAVRPEGLPCADGGDASETLTVRLKDPVNGVRVDLHYQAFGALNVIARHMTVANEGSSAFSIHAAMSASVDFEDGRFSLLTLGGTTLREFTPEVRPLGSGVTQVESTRGSSSHQQSPNAVLLREGADAQQGEAYAFTLLYGGSFALRAEKDAYGACRFQGGINPLGFQWRLQRGAAFDTPQMLLAWTDEGLNGLSHALHPLLLRHIQRGAWKDRARPILLNTWEGCYFDVTEDKLLRMGDQCREAGIELLVLDDGWFGRRDNAQSSLGDWACNVAKFPHGIDGLADRLAEKGVRLGVWVEPEMISPDSELYRAHPDWCLHVEHRVRTQWRNQLVLDLSRDEIVAYIIQSLDRLLQSGKVAYVKWDMNRRLSEVGSEAWPAEQQGELRHRYMLGLYRVLEHLASAYPDVLLENCASGGGRYDYGMYRYFHQGWLSDNTDAVCRLPMQTAASIFYPPVVITSHVSACPNSQTGRDEPFRFRAEVCALFNAGFELNPAALSGDQLAQMKEACERFKRLRDIVRGGRFYRLGNELVPREAFGWMLVDERQAVAGYYRPFCEPEAAYWRVSLPGLDEGARYRDRETGVTLSGRDWRHIGWRPAFRDGDYYSAMLLLEKA